MKKTNNTQEKEGLAQKTTFDEKFEGYVSLNKSSPESLIIDKIVSRTLIRVKETMEQIKKQQGFLYGN